MSDMVLTAARSPSPPHARSRLDRILIVSLLVHALILAIIVLARTLSMPAAPPGEPGFQMVWANGIQSPDAVTKPGQFISMPEGETTARGLEAPAPQVNLAPQEYAEPPPPPAESNEYAPLPPPRPAPPRPRMRPSNNPFANMPIYGAPTRTASATPRYGVHGSRQMDLSMGPAVEGGELRDAIPHMSMEGVGGDYGDLLHQYIESHLYEYPEIARKNGEQGLTAVRVTIARDGTVLNVKLLRSTGSRTLDLAWINLFRSKHLPPFPDNMPDARKDFDLALDYELIYE